jgi:peptidoglycan/LPS O-acetylase OafA/YrhL
LDQLRGVAAVLVLLDHAGCIFFGIDLVPRNLLAVQFFFMLSGFVLASGYDAKLRAGMGIAEFMRRRAIRLYPLILLGAVFGAVVLRSTDPAFAIDPGAAIAVLLAMGCLPGPDGAYSFGFGRFPLNPPEWSLFFELAANAGFAVIAPRLNRYWLAIIAIAASALYGAMTVAAWPEPVAFWGEAIGAIGAFGTGVSIWRWQLGRARSCGSWPARLLGLALASICIIPDSFGPALTPLATIVLFPALIVFGAAKGRSEGSSWLGALSYPLYILHWPTLLLVRAWLLPVSSVYVSFGVGCVVAFGVALCGQHLFDTRSRACLTKVFSRLPQRPASGSLGSRSV